MFVALGGILFLSVNIVGEFINFNRSDLDIPAVRPNQSARSYDWVIKRLAVINAKKKSMTTLQIIDTLNIIVHERMVNFLASDTEVFPVFSVSLFDNWILYAASKLNPSRYRNYTLLDSYDALWRGVGMCGQSSVALVGLLNEYGIRSGLFGLHNHVVVWAEVSAANDYVIADPDYGTVVFASLPQIQSQPEIIDKAYENIFTEMRDYPPYETLVSQQQAAGDDTKGGSRTKLRKFLHSAYANANETKKYPSGVDNSFGENISSQKILYLAKWILPVLMMLPYLFLIVTKFIIKMR